METVRCCASYCMHVPLVNKLSSTLLQSHLLTNIMHLHCISVWINVNLRLFVSSLNFCTATFHLSWIIHLVTCDLFT